jgi:hypothetical protein
MLDLPSPLDGIRSPLGRLRGGTLYLLDQLSTPAAVAYSSRRLSASATLANRVRRSSDNAENNFGFWGGNLDTASLLAHCAGGNGFLTTVYDQSGNGRNFTQITALNQPSIVTAGVVNTQNGRPLINFDGAGDVLHSATGVANTIMAGRAFTAIHVTFSSSGGFGVSGNNADGVGTSPRAYLQRAGFSYNTLSVVVVPTASGGQITSYGHDGVNTAIAWKNGALVGTGTQAVLAAFGGTGTLAVPLTPTTNAGSLGELLIFSSALSDADRLLVERDMGNYYGIAVA